MGLGRFAEISGRGIGGLAPRFIMVKQMTIKRPDLRCCSQDRIAIQPRQCPSVEYGFRSICSLAQSPLVNCLVALLDRCWSTLPKVVKLDKGVPKLACGGACEPKLIKVRSSLSQSFAVLLCQRSCSCSPLKLIHFI